MHSAHFSCALKEYTQKKESNHNYSLRACGLNPPQLFHAQSENESYT